MNRQQFFFTDICNYLFQNTLYWYQDYNQTMYIHSKIRFITLLAIVFVSCFAIDQLPIGETQIQGNYIATLPAPTGPAQPISINLANGNIKIQGCNQLQSTYNYDISTKTFTVAQFSSTRRGCEVDLDSLIVDAFKNAFKVYSKSGVLILENRSGEQLLRFQTGLVSVSTTSVVQGNQVIKSTQVTTKKIITTQVVTTTTTTEVSSSQTVSKSTTLFIVGRYELTLPALQLVINKNSFSLKGCNQHGFDAQLTGSIVKFSQASSTRRACDVDFDRFYLQAFSLGRTLLKISTGYRLLDENSKLLLEFVLQPSGSYLCSVPSVVLSVEPNSLAFQGCNIHSISYQLDGNTGIQFGQVVSTKRSCLFFDYDEYVLNSIKLARNYEILDKTFVLKDGETIFAIALTKVQVPPSSILPVVAQTTSTPVPVPEPVPVPIPIVTVTPTQVIPPTAQVSPTYAPLIVVATPVVAPQPVATTVPTITQVPQIPIPIVIPTPICTPVVITDSQAVVPPVIALPGVAATSLRGTYRIQFLQIDVNPIILVFDDQYVQFQGCNINRVPYAAYNDGLFVILNGGSSTKRQCGINRDQDIVRVLKNINRFVRSETGYVLYQNERSVANINFRIRNQVVTYNVINGGYQVEIPGIEAIVAEDRITFRGCNSVSISYKLGQDGAITFGQAISTLIFCQQDVDGVYTKAITSGVQLKVIPEGYALVDKKGSQTIRFINLYGPRNNGYQYFNGKFRLDLSNAGIRLKITDGTFTLTGCNQFNFRFSLADNGNIIFTRITNTTKAVCALDNDRAFLIALLSAQRIAVFDNTIIFTSGTNVQVAKIINPDIVPNRDTIVLIDPKSPVVRKTDYRLVQGTYTLALLRSSLRKLSLTVQGKTVSFRGCNTHKFSYTAVSDGTIQFQLISSTQKACSEDLDKYYLEAIRNIRRFYAIKGMYTFYDATEKSLITFTAANNIANLITQTGSPVPIPVPIPVPVVTPVIPTPTPIPNPVGYQVDGNLGTSFLPVVQPIIPIVISNPFDNNSGSSSSTTTITTPIITPIGPVGPVVAPVGPLPPVTIPTVSVVTPVPVPVTPVVITQPNQGKQYVDQQDNEQVVVDDKDKTNLDGKYQFELPEIGVQINKDSFIFKGCNTHRFPCTFRRNKIFFGEPISTNKKCENDNDKFFLDLLPKVSTYRKENRKCKFFNSRLQSLFQAQFTEEQQQKQVKAPTPLFGSCLVKIPRIQIQIDNFNINFRGCPRDRFSYRAFNLGSIFFKRGRNPKSCAFQYDDVFKNTIKGCSKFRKNNVGFTFEDYLGVERGRCFRSDW